MAHEDQRCKSANVTHVVTAVIWSVAGSEGNVMSIARAMQAITTEYLDTFRRGALRAHPT
jgi:hypothetical protein